MKAINKQQAFTSRGFTLVEILVVLAMVSLMAGISTAYFAQALPKVKQKAAAGEMAATIKYAKHLAGVKNERQIVTFDLDAGRYGIKGRAVMTIPDETKVLIYTPDVNAHPVQRGQYSLHYDSTGAPGWDRIELVRGDKIIRIKADPLLTAVIDDEERERCHD